MGHDILTQLGLAGLLIYLFLKEMFAFLAKKKNGDGHDVKAIVQKENEALMANLRLLLDARLGAMANSIKDPILADLQATRHDARNGMQSTVAQIANLLKK